MAPLTNAAALALCLLVGCLALTAAAALWLCDLYRSLQRQDWIGGKKKDEAP